MLSEGPRQGAGGGSDVEGLLKSVGVGGGAEPREGGTGERNRKGRRGERGSGLLPLLCGFLYTPCCHPPARESGLQREGAQLRQTLAKEHPAPNRLENTLRWQPSLHLFLEGFIFVLSLF